MGHCNAIFALCRFAGATLTYNLAAGAECFVTRLAVPVIFIWTAVTAYRRPATVAARHDITMGTVRHFTLGAERERLEDER